MIGYDSKLVGALYSTPSEFWVERERGPPRQPQRCAWRFDYSLALAASVTYLDVGITSAVQVIQPGDVAAGNRTTDVPRWSGNFNASWKHLQVSFASLRETTLITSLNYHLMGERAADPQNHFNLDNYEKFDLRAGLESKFGEVYAFADNLLNQTYDTFGF